MTLIPFSGRIEFKLSIRALDEGVVRKALATFSYAPPWPYYHVQSDEERTGKFQLDLNLSVLTAPRPDKHRVASAPMSGPYSPKFKLRLVLDAPRHILISRRHDQEEK